MGQTVSTSDFHWVGSDEPHATRRKLILAKYPQIRKLMGVDPLFKWKTTAIVVWQCFLLYLIKDITNFWLLFIIAYVFIGTANHSLSLAVHEIAHGQAFGHSHILLNKLFGMFANLPIGFPVSVSFKKYHLRHHRYQGDDEIDVDIPSRFEARFFTNTALKLCWVILQPFFYAIRPFFVDPLPLEKGEVVNTLVQLSFDWLIYTYLGGHVLAVMIGGSLLAMGLHPVAGHFISEHYIMFKLNEDDKSDVDTGDESFKCEKGVTEHDGMLLMPETCSYYGILNLLTFNVGYHVEHHDFPSIPGSRLPLVKQIAPEFYNNLKHHTSWSRVIYQYIMDPSVGPYSRVKRPSRKLPSCNGQDHRGTSDANENVTPIVDMIDTSKNK